jgi:hypothetical protein
MDMHQCISEMTGEKMLRSIVVLIGLAFFMLSVSSTNAQETVPNCRVSPMREMELPRSAGQLIYLHDGGGFAFENLDSTNPVFQANVSQYAYKTRISPNGMWIASLELNVENDAFAITRNVMGEITYSTELDSNRIFNFVWLGDDQYLTIAGYPQFRFYAHSIIIHLTGEIQFVYPEFLAESQGADATIPLFEDTIPGGGQNFSRDGRYILAGRDIYDMQMGKFLEPIETGGGYWASASDQLIFLDPSTDQIAGEPIFVEAYDITTDTVRRLGMILVTEGEVVALFNNGGWSPDERFVALNYWFPDMMYSHTAKILDLENGELIDACIRGLEEPLHHFDFAWSRDSRYLALYGALAGETDRETGSVYIYDTLENHIYEVYEGFADIVGWAVHPEQPTSLSANVIQK